MLSFLGWYLLVSLTGILAFPVAYRLLPGLPDRGYAFSRTLGLLLWFYAFWLLASLRILHNDPGGLVFSLLLLALLSAWAFLGWKRTLQGWRSNRDELLGWLRRQRGYLIGVELLFLAAFAAWTLVRAANPEAFATEKPMELAFINSILRSPLFPPADPWLSGYAISYYYFGYVMVSGLAMLTGTPGAVAFNLAIALVFGLSALGAYGLLYNLLVVWRTRTGEADEVRNMGAGGEPVRALLGPFLILLVSNLEGFLEVLHARGLLPASFWTWLDIQGLNTAPEAPFSWLPRLYGTGNWWWWRASRVLVDYDLAGSPREIIDEFPVFSFLLADLHPHVLAMPFAFLAMAISFNLFLGGAAGRLDALRLRLSSRQQVRASALLALAGVIAIFAGLLARSARISLPGLLALGLGMILFFAVPPHLRRRATGQPPDEAQTTLELGFPLQIHWSGLLLAGVVLGGMAFLNTWDFPFYVALFAGAYVAFGLYRRGYPGWGALLKDFLGLVVCLGLLGVLLYLPFYLSFSSQAGGPLPNLIYPTRGVHLWVMFATLFVPLFAYGMALSRSPGSSLRRALPVAIVAVLLLWLAASLFGWLVSILPAGTGELFLRGLAASSSGDLLRQSLARRLVHPGGLITIAALLWLALAALWPKRRAEGEGLGFGPGLSPAHVFALLLFLLGTLLVLAPEFFFLRDQFGWRMNTIFKFYYQAWLLLGVAAAFGTLALGSRLRGIGKFAFRLAFGLVVAMGMFYTVLGIWDKAHGFNPSQDWTLDGSQYIAYSRPDELAAIHWLENAPRGVVAEAVGGSYNPSYARISAFSGQPTVLGWPGHESQWRGGGQEIGSRQADIQRLYCSRDWNEARTVIEQYNIRYIYVGPSERSAYTASTCGTGLFDAKFERNLQAAFREGDVVIYEFRPDLAGLDQTE